ncbi:MAG: hypothetical protein A3J74_11565 [Elusimicrobia bacterium RIFCSPHIGHO2_02_FULL_57_9]|nr:MAG: hypothetical protein A3J74_11565 [Elusimicrobia bacterium RIFCSPHIGHO2_02_FULL_57_9]
MKLYRQLFFVCGALLLDSALSAVPATMSRPEQSGELKDILIEGVSRLSIKADKPLYNPQLDQLPEVQAYLALQLNEAAFTPHVMERLPNYLPSKLGSDIVLSPWHGKLVHQPVLDIVIMNQPKNMIVDSWRLVITDNQGRIFHTIRGKGRFPERMTWDGKGGSGEMVKVGVPYAYSYFVLDSAQVPTYLPGRTILFKGLVQEHMTRTEITMDTKSLFDEKLGFSPMGQSCLREAQDVLRRTPNRAIRVEIYGPDVETAQKQADAIKRYLAAALHLREGRIMSRGLPLERDRYPRTEILAK